VSRARGVAGGAGDSDSDSEADAKSAAPWYRQAAAVVLRHWLVKCGGTLLFIAVFFAAYFYLLKHPAYPPTTMPIIWPDRLIGFEPLALPLYLSIWVYVSLPPALLETRYELYAYGRAMAAMCLAGLVVFFFWPTTVPVAAIDWALYPDVGFLKRIDAAGNACPSLHVATAVFSAAALARSLRHFGAPRAAHVVNGLWCAGIIYSTIATRQHVVIDVLGGLVLGTLGAWLSLRQRARSAPAAAASKTAKAPDLC